MCHVCAVNPDKHCGNGPNGWSNSGPVVGCQNHAKNSNRVRMDLTAWLAWAAEQMPTPSIDLYMSLMQKCFPPRVFFTHRLFQVCRDCHPLLIFDIHCFRQAVLTQSQCQKALSLRSAPGDATACIRNLSRDSLIVIIKTCLLFASSSKTSVAFSDHSTSES